MKPTACYPLLFAFVFLPVSTASVAAPIATRADTTATARFSDYGHAGAWLLQREGGDARVLHGVALASQPKWPASTIKVLLALIALETGVLRDGDEQIPWNGRVYPDHPEWKKPMALRQAMQTSSESYFGVLAERIGRERLQQWVARTNYGNGRIGADPAKAWHDGVLTVTAGQQLDFIERMRRGTLPFSPANLSTVKAAMLEDDVDGRRIYGKTGTHGRSGDQSGVGWWIGWVEGGDEEAASFVLEVDLQRMDQRAQRVELGERLLADSGLLIK